MISHVRLAALVFMLATLLPTVESKINSRTISIPELRREGAWVFLDRMHVAPGAMQINFTLSLLTHYYKQDSYDIELAVVPHHVWELESDIKCYPKYSQKEKSLLQQEEFVVHALIAPQNNFTFTTQTNLEVKKEETYHFVLRQCSKMILGGGYGTGSKLELLLEVKSNGNYHSSTESMYGWLLPLLIGVGSGMLWLLYREKEEEGDNWMKWGLKISLWLGVFAVGFKYTGYLFYVNVSGYESNFTDFMYLLLHAISDTVLMLLLLFLAYGWTVQFKRSRDFDIYGSLAGMLGIINIMMTLFNKIADGSHDKYHMFDTTPAYVMMGFRLLTFLVFLAGIVRSLLAVKPNNPKQKKYLTELALLGSLYLCFVPVGFALVRVVDSRYRKEAMYFGVELTRLGLSLWMSVLSGWKGSAYRTIIDQSFMEKGEKYM